MKKALDFITKSKVSRRISKDTPRFPMKAESNEVILRDRRVVPDRRNPGIQTQEIKVSEEEFEQLFDVYQQQNS